MDPEDGNSARLRLELSHQVLRELKRRAAVRQLPLDAYVGMVVRYGIHERIFPPETSPLLVMEEKIYLTAIISPDTKERLAGWSQKRKVNLAGFAGGMAERFLRTFERDPRDLAMIDFAALLAERGGVPSISELGAAIRLCEQLEGRATAGHFSRWLFSRLKPLIGQVEREGVITELSLQWIEEWTAGGTEEG